MRRWTCYLLVGVLAFFCGLGVDAGRRFLDAPKPYCEIAQNADEYHLKRVRVKGHLVIDSEGLFLFESCEPNQILDTAVEFDGELATPLRELVAHQSALRFRWQQADVIVEGQFDAHYTLGCFGTPKFRIQAERLELVGPLRPFQLQ